MKTFVAMAAIGLTVMASTGPLWAQPYGGPDYGYRERGREYRHGGYGFDEREYLRCNPDVRRAVYRGEMGSGLQHYQLYGRNEGRRLSC